MLLNELLPALRDLPRADKWRVVEFLVLDLAKEEGALFNGGAAYPVWSPYDSFEAADALLAALKTEDQHA